MLAGRPHEAVGNASPRWMTVAPRKRGHRTRPTGRLTPFPPPDLRLVVAAGRPLHIRCTCAGRGCIRGPSAGRGEGAVEGSAGPCAGLRRVEGADRSVAGSRRYLRDALPVGRQCVACDRSGLDLADPPTRLACDPQTEFDPAAHLLLPPGRRSKPVIMNGPWFLLGAARSLWLSRRPLCVPGPGAKVGIRVPRRGGDHELDWPYDQ